MDTEPDTISTGLHEVAKLAKRAPDLAFTTLGHHLTVDALRVAFSGTRRDGAAGVDGQTAAGYEEHLEENLQSLLNRAKSGTYQAPPVRRTYIPKANGQLRPIGIPTLEDKVLQRAVVTILEAIYEQDFLDCSYGFRPRRSAHQALRALREALGRGRWVLEVDIQSFFDSIDHGHLRSFLDRRVRDGMIRRLIGKWMNAGVMEEGRVHHPEAGTPQGGVISPLLANVFLHYVLDEWFAMTVKPRLRKEARLIRYADDFVIVFQSEQDARRVCEVLPKRFARFGLTLHPKKTRLLSFDPPKKRKGGGDPGSDAGRRTFDFLGFTWYWGRTLKGGMAVKLRTAKNRWARALKSLTAWCRENRHKPISEQHRKVSEMLRGHYQYYGVTFNYLLLKCFLDKAKRAWRTWLSRRGRKGSMPWERFVRLLKRHPLPTPRIRVSIFPTR